MIAFGATQRKKCLTSIAHFGLLATVANADTFDITLNKLITMFIESETVLDY